MAKKYAEVETKELAKLLATKEMFMHYRDYFKLFHSFINDSVIHSGHLDEQTWDELLEQELKYGSLDYYAMLGHIDSLEKDNQDLVESPMIPHKPYFCEEE